MIVSYGISDANKNSIEFTNKTHSFDNRLGFLYNTKINNLYIYILWSPCVSIPGLYFVYKSEWIYPLSLILPQCKGPAFISITI